MDTRKLSTVSSAASVDLGGGATTSSPRNDLAMAYGRALLRLEENYFYCAPVERFRQPVEMQRLLDRRVSSPLLGSVEVDGQMRNLHEFLGIPAFCAPGKRVLTILGRHEATHGGNNDPYSGVM